MSDIKDFALSCPISIQEYPNVLLAHGGGGKLMHGLIEKMFMPSFSNQILNLQHDGAVLDLGKLKAAFTTDSYVVYPLFFPGGDIGKLAINGTVNDLAMCGARPLYISVGFILEEGFPMETLWRVVNSVKATAETANVEIVTGDTKVVDKGKGDGMYINTSGIGIIEHGIEVSPTKVQDGDLVLLSGDIGRHGITIMSMREELALESEIKSDTSPLSNLVMDLLEQDIEVHCMRDLTRGGLASALIEIAEASGTHIHIDENAIPVSREVRATCEILGLDPLYVANEGRFIAFVKPSDSEATLKIMRSYNSESSLIGSVDMKPSGIVTMKSKIGTNRIIDMLSGEQLPRIC